MKRLACVILIIITLIGGLAVIKPANATYVKGIISTDTHWTQADSPIIFNGTVTIGNNVTLTIDPGVTVNLGMYALMVYGTLRCVGEAGNEIVFTATVYVTNFSTSNNLSSPILFLSSSTPWNNADNSGSIIQFAILNSISIQTNNASPKIDNCVFNYRAWYQPPISISGGSPIISNSIIVYNSQGAGVSIRCISIFGGTPLITNNKFEAVYTGSGSDIDVNSGSPSIINNLFEGDYSNSDNGINIASGTPSIINNQFDGEGYLNAIVSYSSNSFTISKNVFSDCASGITAEPGSALTVDDNSFLRGTDGIDVATDATVIVTHNLVDGNSRYGIDGGGYIDSNTITNNQVGIHNPPAGTISNNNIVGNTMNSITTTTANINAQNNWWGIADAQTINQTIYDAKIDNHLGTVTFVPFLTQPSSTAPSIPASTPTVTPVPSLAPLPTPTDPPGTAAPTPFQYSQSFIYQASTILNLNLITTVTAVILVLVWIIVILGYVAKAGISKYKGKNKKIKE